MKTTTFAVAAISLLQIASAQPFRARRHAHEQKHAKKDAVTVVNTVYANANPTDTPDFIVYVNQDGTPYSTETKKPAVATAAPAVAAPVAQVNAAAVQAPAKSSSAPAASTSSTGGKGFGFSYSPYKADGGCKDQQQVDKDIAAVGDGYSLVRIYGTDCNQVTTVLSAAKAKGLKLFAGIFDIKNLDAEVAKIVAAANGDWSQFQTISVGNELVNAGAASPEAVVAAIGTARGLLKAAGYTGNVVTVDTLVAARANPSLCDASDFCAVNCHPFFDGNTAAAQSGDFLKTQIPTLQAKLKNSNQKIIITETGWPTQGLDNKAAKPSKPNQEAAISSIKSAFSSDPSSVILFTAYNDLWKTNTADQFQAEQYWGFLGAAPSS